MSGVDLPHEAARWLEYAMGDLRTAEGLRKLEDAPPRNACYFAQQAVEKALKAVLVFEGREVPRTHDLDALRVLLPDGWSVKSVQVDLSVLSEWAVNPRYPGDLPEATEEDADEAVKDAREVIVATANDFRERGLDP